MDRRGGVYAAAFWGTVVVFVSLALADQDIASASALNPATKPAATAEAAAMPAAAAVAPAVASQKTAATAATAATPAAEAAKPAAEAAAEAPVTPATEAPEKQAAEAPVKAATPAAEAAVTPAAEAAVTPAAEAAVTPAAEAPGKQAEAPGKQAEAPGKQAEAPGKQAEAPGKQAAGAASDQEAAETAAKENAETQAAAAKPPAKAVKSEKSEEEKASGEEEAPEKEASEEETEKYSKIPFFIFKDGAKRENKAKSTQDCAISCNKRDDCKSFSFSARKSDCLWSKYALTFNGEFTFYTRKVFAGPKEVGKNLLGKYRSFDGLMFMNKDFTKYMGMSLKKCRRYCDQGEDGHGRRCNGFSYRERDQTCLLSPFGLQYDPDYDYYERNPEPVPLKVEKVDKATGKVSVVEVPGKKTVPPLDVKMKNTKPAWNQSPEYKAALQTQETAAKAGTKELAHKQRSTKRGKKSEQKMENQIEILKEQQEQTLVKKKRSNVKAIKEQIEKREEATQREEEATNKKFQLTLQMEKEAAQKKQDDMQERDEKQHEKEQAELSRELKIKTELKKQRQQEESHKEALRKKIAVLVQQGRSLAHTERKNKEKAYNAEENNAKKKIVKMQVTKILANRHSRHKKEFDKFVKDTTERHLKTRDTEKQVSIAMKQTKKQRQADLENTQEELKATRAITHAISLEIEKLKAQSDGYQHEINMDAKRGKKSPQAEVKLQYTMDNLRNEQNKEAYRKQEVEKLERKVLEEQDSLKKLDQEMTKKGIGRRRRQVEDSTHAGPQVKKRVKPIMPEYEQAKTTNPALDRRRRSQARLNSEYMGTVKQSGGDGRTVLPGVPMVASTFTGQDPDDPTR